MTTNRDSKIVCCFIAAGMAYIMGHVLVAELPLGIAAMVGCVIVLAIVVAIAYHRGWIR